MSSTTPSLFSTRSPEPSPARTSLSPSSASLLSQSLASLASALPSGTGTTGTTPATNSSAGEPIVRTQTPIFACVPASYNISGGQAPYPTVFLIKSGDANANVLKTLPFETNAGTFSWGVDVHPGTSVTFVVKDALGAAGYSVPITVQTNSDLSCLPNQKKSSTAAIAGGVSAGVVAVLLGLLVFFFYRRRKSRRDADEVPPEAIIEGSYGERIVVGAASGPGRTKSVSRSSVHELSEVGVERKVSGRAAGTFNLGKLDFSPASLDRLADHPEKLPDYEEDRKRRAAGDGTQ